MDLYSRVKIGTPVVVLPGRPPATEADAACTARWCIGAAQRSVGNERPARSASLRHGAVRNTQSVRYCTANTVRLTRLVARSMLSCGRKQFDACFAKACAHPTSMRPAE